VPAPLLVNPALVLAGVVTLSAFGRLALGMEQTFQSPRLAGSRPLGILALCPHKGTCRPSNHKARSTLVTRRRTASRMKTSPRFVPPSA
jgi:hypothetical protein